MCEMSLAPCRAAEDPGIFRATTSVCAFHLPTFLAYAREEVVIIANNTQRQIVYFYYTSQLFFINGDNLQFQAVAPSYL